MCTKHYQRFMHHGDPDVTRRSDAPFIENRRVSFTPDIWGRWWKSRMPDNHTLRLRAGIYEMRKVLEMRAVRIRRIGVDVPRETILQSLCNEKQFECLIDRLNGDQTKRGGINR